MKKMLAAAALVAAFSAAPAKAEMLDMSTVTCGALATMGEDEVAWFLIWLDGYLAGQADSTQLDITELGNQIDGIAKVCTEKPDLSVLNAAKEYLGE
ncbi:MAG: hypothetical protein IPL47_11565 [Phyllobacteriaceae bacterium]|nr:hypothetical protein [Phyllobacteriaceae bacterium]